MKNTKPRMNGRMNSTPVVWRDVDWDYVKQRVPYMDPQLYYNLRDHIYADFNYIGTNDLAPGNPRCRS